MIIKPKIEDIVRKNRMQLGMKECWDSESTERQVVCAYVSL